MFDLNNGLLWIYKDIQLILDEHTDTWGVKVTNVEIKHVDLDESMIRAIAKQAEAERQRRAKIIHAEGEYQAAGKLTEAADQLSKNPNAMRSKIAAHVIPHAALELGSSGVFFM